MPEETEARSPDPMAVSLDLELLTLADAIRGAEMLADYQARQGFMDEASEKDAPVCVFSILSLVGGRLKQLRRVVRGEEDPVHLWGPHNETDLPETLAEGVGDIILFPWKARGRPLVFARPSTWRVEPEEKKGRAAVGHEATRQKGQKSPKGRKAKTPKHSGAKKAAGPVGETPNAQGDEQRATAPVSP
ncbi:hypothetical protein [Archangium primigenium]|uniref:hypothetical protein n=1 Tax=[Archangium] primigenium TaxID=2792470 RepID=UPI00195679D1|nr:hypothetical protein [Archangium primigenium]MBM7117660.1 hypothetical protein [Archangium primigenium]